MVLFLGKSTKKITKVDVKVVASLSVARGDSLLSLLFNVFLNFMFT